MSDDIHIAITRRVRSGHLAEFERLLADFSRRSLAEPGARGMHFLHPPPGSSSAEYGILHSFASVAERDAFYQSRLYRQWLKDIAPLTEGEAIHRELSGLEAWFRNSEGPHPPRWKMAVLTWVAVWPVSMIVPAVLLPSVSPFLHPILAAGTIAAGIVSVLTWGAMPLLVKMAHPWLQTPNREPQI
jgi:antibiotic biosynthesis monooxygenase (ABM) superfamily enzyme